MTKKRKLIVDPKAQLAFTLEQEKIKHGTIIRDEEYTASKRERKKAKQTIKSAQAAQAAQAAEQFENTLIKRQTSNAYKSSNQSLADVVSDEIERLQSEKTATLSKIKSGQLAVEQVRAYDLFDEVCRGREKDKVTAEVTDKKQKHNKKKASRDQVFTKAVDTWAHGDLLSKQLRSERSTARWVGLGKFGISTVSLGGAMIGAEIGAEIGLDMLGFTLNMTGWGIAANICIGLAVGALGAFVAIQATRLSERAKSDAQFKEFKKLVNFDKISEDQLKRLKKTYGFKDDVDIAKLTVLTQKAFWQHYKNRTHYNTNQCRLFFTTFVMGCGSYIASKFIPGAGLVRHATKLGLAFAGMGIGSLSFSFLMKKRQTNSPFKLAKSAVVFDKLQEPQGPYKGLAL